MVVTTPNRRHFLGYSAIFAIVGYTSDSYASTSKTLRQVAKNRGIEIGAMALPHQLRDSAKEKMFAEHFTLINIGSDAMEWDRDPGINYEPSFSELREYINFCKKNNLRLRARNVYSDEARPNSVHLREDGTPKNKSELEKTLITRATQACSPLKGTGAIIQVMDEILANNEGGFRKNPFYDALGDRYVDIIFHAAHDAAPDALLTYQEFGPEVDPNGYFKRKTRDHLKLLEDLRKRNVPITGAAYGGFFQIYPGDIPENSLKKSYFRNVQDLDYDIHLNELSIIYKICANNDSWIPRSQRENDKKVEYLYTKVFSFFCQFKRLKELSFWAPIDNDNTIETGTLCVLPYKDARPGIFNRDLSKKPIYGKLASIVEKSIR